MRFRASLLFLFLFFFFYFFPFPARPAQAGDLAGRIAIGPPAFPEPADGKAPPPPRSPPREGAAVEPVAIVLVERVEPGSAGFDFPDDAPPKIEMSELAFRPREVVVRAGGRVAFANQDDLFHQPFSCSRGNRFDLGRYRKGEEPEVTFAEPGVARVYCEVHPEMRAYVVVVQNPFFARVNPDGTFLVRGVPPGRHVLAVVYEGDVLGRMTVDVPESGDAPRIDWAVAAAPTPGPSRGTPAAPAACCARVARVAVRR